MVKRGKLEIMRDILNLVRDNNKIKPTPLLRKSGLSSSSFKEYYKELLDKGLISELDSSSDRYVILSEKGFNFLQRYSTIVDFIEEFEL